MKSNSIKFEISFFHSVILGGSLFVFIAVIYFILSSALYSQFDYDLQLKAQEIGNSLRSYADLHGGKEAALIPGAQAIVEAEQKNGRWWPRLRAQRRWFEQASKIAVNEGYVNFIAADGQSFVSSRNITAELMPFFVRAIPRLAGEKPVFRSFSHGGQHIRLVNVPFVYKNNTRYFIQVGTSQQSIVQLLQDCLFSMMLSIPVILVLSSFAGWILTKRLLAPVQDIIETAQRITSEGLDTRVKEEEYVQEMESLVHAFNGMIARLEKSFKHIEEFSSYVAHELKTPLTIMRGEAELALRETNIKECHAAFNIILNEIEDMLKTIEDLLYLTRVDYQSTCFRMEKIDFVEFFREIVEQSKILAAAKKIHVTARWPDDPIVVEGDSGHLKRLFFNLIDNALKFTLAGGRLDLILIKEKGEAVVSVADSGRGIAEKNISKVFDKFFREDNSQFGNGLGLSIAQAIIKAHRGTISARSRPNQGTVFTVRLPLAPSA